MVGVALGETTRVRLKLAAVDRRLGGSWAAVALRTLDYLKNVPSK